MTMKNIYKRLLTGAFIFAIALPLFARQKSVDELVADLAAPKQNTVISALQGIEKLYPTDTNAQVKVRALLTDSRSPVKRKAARVLGAINADVSAADLKNIATLLTGDKGEMTDGLKALRGLKAQSTIPQITPLLQNSDLNIKRDAIRTLAVLGDKSLVPTIQPFLTYPDLAVQKDAADAISILKLK
jgi:HEAT repeat protein